MGKYRCIFCGSAEKLTREHIWPNWLRAYVPRVEIDGRKNRHLMRTSDGEIREGKLNRPGHTAAQRLQVVCRRCNNGWMSELQEAAKRVIVPLLSGDWANLDTTAQGILARWSIMFSMVFEHCRPSTTAIPQAHRTYLMESKDVPPDWVVWIGRCTFGVSNPNSNHHRGQIFVPPSKPADPPEVFCFQSTGFTVGPLFFQTLMLTPSSAPYRFYADAFATEFDLRVIHPPASVLQEGPSTPLTWERFYEATNIFAAVLGAGGFSTPDPT